MKKLVLILIVIFAGCSNPDKDAYVAESSSFENINYITLTNENIDGGSQIVYVKIGLTEDDVKFCFF
tara:strand:- start:191 stop:391 length:201 start_codon:yes stop_codon:yes gene_type:complete